MQEDSPNDQIREALESVTGDPITPPELVPVMGSDGNLYLRGRNRGKLHLIPTTALTGWLSAEISVSNETDGAQ